MKKLLIFAVVLSLLLPAAAFAATEFALGGYIKLDTFWDSTQNSSLIHLPAARSNNVADEHGRFNMRGQESRFNFTIKGPKVFGAQLTGFIEMDFDGTPDDAAVSSAGTWNLRLRHAMFRLNWPETELLMGQYWGLFSNWWIESAEDGPFLMYGSGLDRIPQIRLTQTFLGDWSVAGLVGLPIGATLDNGAPYSANANNGSASETPQIQGMVKYAHDLWGKAAYYGVPNPFTVTVSAGWERAVNRSAAAAAGTMRFFDGAPLGNNYGAGVAGTINQKSVDPWIVEGAMFIPVIATHSANLAGTASILTQWFVGQGVEVFGITGNGSNLFTLNPVGGVAFYNVSLLNRFGGFAQAQYYFTNQWFVNAAYGITRCFGVNRDSDYLFNATAGTADQFRTMQTVDATLWYRPIQALKFGLQYSFARSDYFQKTPSVAGGVGAVSAYPTDSGNEHRVEFVGIFYF